MKDETRITSPFSKKSDSYSSRMDRKKMFPHRSSSIVNPISTNGGLLLNHGAQSRVNAEMYEKLGEYFPSS